MKKRILIGIAAAVVVAMSAVSVNIALQGNNLSELSLANVEALAGEAAGCNGCKDIGWGTQQILKCDCHYTGIWSSCNNWGC
jgi:hypothetical protein